MAILENVGWAFSTSVSLLLQNRGLQLGKEETPPSLKKFLVKACQDNLCYQLNKYLYFLSIFVAILQILFVLAIFCWLICICFSFFILPLKAEMKRFTNVDTSVLKQHYEKKVQDLELEKRALQVSPFIYSYVIYVMEGMMEGHSNILTSSFLLTNGRKKLIIWDKTFPIYHLLLVMQLKN